MQRIPKYLLSALFLLLLRTIASGQGYRVQYIQVDSGATVMPASLPRKFNTQSEAESFINNLPATLQAKGYAAVSVDSVVYDSLQARVVFFLGPQYRWASVRTRPQDASLLETIQWPARGFAHKNFDLAQLRNWQERILDYLEETGHPFGRVFLDSIAWEPETVTATLMIDRGPAYTIDSIRVIGNVTIRPEVLEHYLDMPKGSPFNRKKLEGISARIRELAYVQETSPSTVSLRGTGGVVNLYLQPRRSSQINALIGFLPNPAVGADKKFLVTGEANILLRNSLGAGETIGLNWQQLQLKSPRLTLQYQHPYLFHTPAGLAFAFDMLRKDSSWLNVNMSLGATYAASGSRAATVFLQRRQTILSTVDTTAIRLYKRLPAVADVASNNLGVAYAFANTNYRFNPQRGSELSVTGAAGIKRVQPNNQVAELRDTAFSYASLYDTVKLKTYQVRITAAAAHYVPVGRQSVLKTALNLGLFQSGSYYFNELFQVGGYKLLRGFTEESQFLSHYALGTLEYRYLVGPNSHFFGFVDGGWGSNAAGKGLHYTYLGTGLGLSLETGAGIFNLAWALGKRNDTEMNLRQSKVHLGFVNYF